MSTVATSPVEHVSLSKDWRDWVQTNIDRGCTIESMVDQMVAAGLERAFALRNVIALKSAANIKPHVTTSNSAKYIAGPSRLPGDHVIEIEGHRVQVMARWRRPLIAVLDNVLSPAECEELMEASRVKLQRSTVADPNSGARSVIQARTSEGTWWDRNSTDLITKIDNRLSKLTGWAVEHGEGLQVMRYGVGGEYKPHFDYFPPEQKGSAFHMARGGQRVATMLMYLQPPLKGGETTFPDVGISIIPKQGSAVFFEYMDESGNLDSMTLHAGAPVIQGEKWIATRWIRERAF
jgi:prolyl 4-hydroxylase